MVPETYIQIIENKILITNMKKVSFAIAIALMFVGINGFAQGKYGADSANCVTNLSYYREYFKQKNYADALPNWRRAYKYCPPTANENLLIHGTTLLNLEAKKAKGEERAALVDSILTLQDQRALYFPAHATTALNNKGAYVANFLQGDPARAHGLLSEIMMNLDSQVNPSIVENDFRSVIELFNAGKINAEEVMNIYSSSTALLDKIEPKDDKAAEALSQSKSNVQGLFLNSRVANCEELVKLFTPRLDADPENLQLIKSIVSMLNAAEDCTGNDLYIKAVTSLYRMEPSHGAAYALYRMNAARGNKAEAVRYLEEAYNSPEAGAQKSDYAIELARYALTSGQTGKAYEMANNILASGSANNGAAYMIIARVWGATRCGGDEISSRAPYWVACDYLNKAKAADPSLTDEANTLIGRYSAYFPQAAEAFMYNIQAGQSYTVSCGGMRAVTTVRTNR